MIYPSQIPQARVIRSFWLNPSEFTCSTGLKLEKPAFLDFVAHGVCGNEEGEYGLTWPPGAGDKVHGVPTAHGIAQWHKDRQDKILKATGIDILTADCLSQQWAMWWELTNTCKPALAAIKAAASERDVVVALVNKFEFSGNRSLDITKRTGYALKWRDFFAGATS